MVKAQVSLLDNSHLSVPRRTQRGWLRDADPSHPAPHPGALAGLPAHSRLRPPRTIPYLTSSEEEANKPAVAEGRADLPQGGLLNRARLVTHRSRKMGLIYLKCPHCRALWARAVALESTLAFPTLERWSEPRLLPPVRGRVGKSPGIRVRPQSPSSIPAPRESQQVETGSSGQDI